MPHTFFELICLALIALIISKLAPGYANVMGILMTLAVVRYLLQPWLQLQLSYAILLISVMAALHGLFTWLLF